MESNNPITEPNSNLNFNFLVITNIFKMNKMIRSSCYLQR